MRRLFFSLLLATLALLSHAQTLPGGLPVTASRKRALVIGCGAYEHLSPLAYPRADAEAVAAALKEGYGFEPGAIRLLSEGGRPEDLPSAAHILAALDEALADPRLDRGDLFILYFSGHGIGRKSGDYLMPTDVAEADAETKGVPVRGIVERFVKAGLRNVLVIADACRAGEENPFGADLIRLGREANLGILLGCAPGGRSYEYPSLGHGAFTHYLLKALADPALADPATGAVFASSLGEKVQRKTKGYTEADHGDAPQVPSVWAEKTQDALLAIYPPKGESVAGLQAQAPTGDRARLVKYLSGLGEALPYDAEGSLAGAGALKALDALGEATDADRYRLLRRLRNLGRDAEMAPVSRALVRAPESSPFRTYGIVVSHPEDVGRDVYVPALARIAASGDLGNLAPSFVDTLLDHRVGASDAERIVVLDELAGQFKEGTRPGVWLRARTAELKRDYEGALKLVSAGEVLGGTYPDAEDFDEIRFDALDGLNRKPEAIALADARLRASDSGHRSVWRRRVLNLARLTKAPDFLDRLHAAAADAENPYDLVSLLMSAGSDAPKLLPEAQAVAARFPYSWEARAGIWLCEVSTDFKEPRAFTAEDLKYAPNALRMMAFAYGKADILMDQAQDAGRAEGYTGRRFRERLAAMMMVDSALFETPMAIQAWARLVEGTPRSFESAIRLQISGAKALDSDGEGSELARIAALYVFISGGLPDEARRTYGLIKKRGELAPLAVFRLGTSLALAGDGVSALAVLDDADPETRKDTIYSIARVLALQTAGRKEEAAKLFDSLGRELSFDTNGLLLFRIVQHRIGRGQALSNELAGAFANPPRGRLDLVAAAFLQLEEGFAADPAKWAKEREALASFAADFPGNPLFGPFRFRAAGAPDAPSDFYGRYVLEGLTGFAGVGEVKSVTTYTLDVGPNGVSGTLVDGGEKESHTIKEGGIDANGNLTGLLDVGKGQEMILFLKLPPGRIAAQILEKNSLTSIIMLDAPLFGGTEFTNVTFTPLAAKPSGAPKTAAKPVKKAGGARKGKPGYNRRVSAP